MKLTKKDEPIKDLDGKPLGRILIDLDILIMEVKREKDIGNLLKSLEEMKKKNGENSITYKKVYEQGCFESLKGITEGTKFLNALELANKIRKGENLDDTEVETLKDGIAAIPDHYKTPRGDQPTEYTPMVKAMAIDSVKG